VASYYMRFGSLASARRRAQAVAGVRAQGEEHLHEALSKGTGAILVSVHLGDFDLAGAWLAARHGVTPVVVTKRMRPRWRHWLFARVRRRCGVVVCDVEHTGVDDLRAELARGRLVLAMLDRRSPGQTTTSNLLGRPALAPLGIATLAASTGAPLLPAATWRDNRETVAWFGETIRTGSTAEAVAALTATAERLSAHIRARPQQWHIPAETGQLAWTVPVGRPSVLKNAGEGFARHVPGSAHGAEGKHA
jgi:KDO2-lipid IV(A) lauroyltransferase